MDRILAAAQAVATARRTKERLAALAPEIAPRDEVEGYEVQRALRDLLLPQFGALVGYKIGCTSNVMQEYLKIPHPCAGSVFERGVHESGVKLSRDLSPGEAPFTAEWVGEAIEAYLPAIEIVDDRYVQWETLGAPTLVADDFFAAACVLGPAVPRGEGPDVGG